MRLRLLLTLLLLLSGCLGSGKGPASTPTSTEPPPLVPADADYGGLEGFVFDADVLPRANATVLVDGTNRSAVTDALGYWSLVPMDPGSYVLIVNETNFVAVRRTVSVTPGQGLRVDFSLREVPVPEPYFDDGYVRRGQINCQARVNASQNTNPDCTEVGSQATGPYLPSGRGANITVGADVWAVLLELEWQSSVASNDRLRIAVRPNEGETWRQFEGKSVLRVPMDQATMTEFSAWAQKDYRANGGQMFFLVYAGESASTAAGGAGATVQQDYTLYVTVFYRMDIPEKFTRIAP
jgi:hypothetical protein